MWLPSISMTCSSWDGSWLIHHHTFYILISKAKICAGNYILHLGPYSANRLNPSILVLVVLVTTCMPHFFFKLNFTLNFIFSWLSRFPFWVLALNFPNQTMIHFYSLILSIICTFNLVQWGNVEVQLHSTVLKSKKITTTVNKWWNFWHFY